MIQNIVIPMPMPMHGGGCEDSFKTVVAIMCAVFITSVMLYIIGYLHDGVKNGDWHFHGGIDECLCKMLGAMGMAVTIALSFGGGIFLLIYSWL